MLNVDHVEFLMKATFAAHFQHR